MHEKFPGLLQNRAGRSVAGGLAAAALTLGAQACDGGHGDQQTVIPVPPGAAIRDIGTVLPTPGESRSAVVPSLTPSITPQITVTSEVTSTPARTSTTAPTAENTDMAVRFGEAFGLQNNWLEVHDPESLRNVTEFTALMQVRLKAGIIPQFVQSDAVFSMGENVEGFAVFTALSHCLDAGIAVVIDGDPYCSHIALPRDQNVTFGVTFKDNEITVIAGNITSEPIKTKKGIPRVTGSFYIGASPKGTDDGFSGEIGDLVILKKALTPEEVKVALAQIRSKETRKLLVTNGNVLALWTFDKLDGYKDLSGHVKDAIPRGNVSQVEVGR